MGKFRGYLWGILSGASFGLIPLFTLPLMASGYSNDAILFYRFGMASLIIGAILAVRGESFRITFSELKRLILLAVLYMSSALFLLWGYDYMPAGVATTIHFLYPVCVVVVMMLVFGERPSLTNVGAVILAVTGVAMLSVGDDSAGAVPVLPLVIVIVSALAYGLYIISLRRMKVRSMNSLKLTFYVMTLTALMFLCKCFVSHGALSPVVSWGDFFNISMLALIPTVLSNFALVAAVRAIGSITASILGACEPLTAVVVGISFFGERMTTPLAIGIGLIIAAVCSIVLKKRD